MSWNRNSSHFILAYPEYQKAFLVCSDTSNKAIIAVLSQLDDNVREYPIHYASRVLSDTEFKYSAFGREALGVIFALKKFWNCLISYKFKLYTDHQALKYAFNMKDPHGQIDRCSPSSQYITSRFVIGPGRIIPVQITYLGPAELIWLWVMPKLNLTSK